MDLECSSRHAFCSELDLRVLLGQRHDAALIAAAVCGGDPVESASMIVYRRRTHYRQHSDVTALSDGCV